MDNIQEDQESARLAMLDMLYEAQLQALKQPIMGSPGLAVAGRTGPLGFRSGTSVVAQGDSWFDYLPGNDIIKALKRRGFIIKNYGSGGDTLENMLFGSTYRDGNWGRYPAEHLKVLESLKIIQPKFFCFPAVEMTLPAPNWLRISITRAWRLTNHCVKTISTSCSGRSSALPTNS